MKRLVISLGLLAAALAVQAQTTVWTCVAGSAPGSGAWAVPAPASAAEFCTGSACGNSPTGWIAGTCKLPSAAAATDTVHVSTDGGATSSWVAKSTLYSAVVPVTVAKTFSWNAATVYDDGSVLTGATYNLYLDGLKLNTTPVTGLAYATPVAVGAHSVTATAVSSGVEGDKSTAVAFTVSTSTKPGTVTGLAVK